jgi:hypothetical protein
MPQARVPVDGQANPAEQTNAHGGLHAKKDMGRWPPVMSRPSRAAARRAAGCATPGDAAGPWPVRGSRLFLRGVRGPPPHSALLRGRRS